MEAYIKYGLLSASDHWAKAKLSSGKPDLCSLGSKSLEISQVNMKWSRVKE